MIDARNGTVHPADTHLMQTDHYIRSVEAQILGRVFTLDESVHFVLDIDDQTGMARCSRKTPKGPGIIYMPVAEVRLWLAEEIKAREISTLSGFDDSGFEEESPAPR